MRMDVVIPTRDRLGKLKVCLGSLGDALGDSLGKVVVYFSLADVS